MKTKHGQVQCPNSACKAKINPSNAATNFANPVLSAKIAVEKGIIRGSQRILEFGSGNLRNALFILNSVPDTYLFTYDLQNTVERFAENYQRFKEIGGTVVKADYGSQKYDVVLCTFVLETICPEQQRVSILRSILSILKKRGVLIASFRGYPGVRGAKYKKCPMGEGLVTPLNTFVRPYSIPELKNLFFSCGFKLFSSLQNYRVDQPENIHIKASLEV